MSSSSLRWSDAARAAAAAVLLASSLGAVQALKIATLVPEGSLWDKAERELGAAIQAATSGRVKFQIYPGGVAGDEPDFLRKIRINQLQGALFSAPGLGDIDPAFYIFQVPLLFETDEEVRYVLDRMRPVLGKRLEDRGCVLVHWSNVGWLRIFASKPVASYDDFRKRKQFVWGSEGRMPGWYKELGLQPVSLSGADVLTGLQTGLIEALPATPLAALTLQWFRPAPHMLDHRFAPLLGGLVLSKSAWEKIAAEDRTKILELSRAAEARLFEDIPEREKEAVTEMQKRGLDVSIEPESDAEKWLRLGREFQARFRTHSVPPEIFDQAVRLLEEHRQSR
jgi:TRAP-type C4-dicarboxylate transport system substrate-binding protein